MVSKFDEFVMSEYDIHVSNSTNDTQLYNDLRALSQAAIQNGQATISDLIAITQSESVQEISKRLEESARKIKEENDALQQQQLKIKEQEMQVRSQQDQAKQMFEMKKHEDEIAVKREQIEANLQIAGLREASADNRVMLSETSKRMDRVDTDKNGIDDFLDLRRTDVDENHKKEQIRIAEEKLAETTRANLAKEEIQREALGIKKQEEKQNK